MKRLSTFNKLALACILLLIVAYSNHFGNSFHFDDDHSIVNNAFIRNLNNIPKFFKSAETFSSLPANQTYRPMLTTFYALDYSVGEFNTFFFHLPIFIFYLLQGILMYLVIIKLFDNSYASPSNKYFALFASAWYMFNTANADVINYISASSDSISTFWVVAALAHFIYYPKLRKWHIYLIPAAIGALFKQSALVFPGLLAIYCFLFENEISETKSSFYSKLKSTLIAVVPALVLCVILYEVQAKLTSSTYITGGSPFNYMITQPFVTLHYFFTFFVPIGLSADTDWLPLDSISNYRFWLGIAFLLILIFCILRLLSNKKMAPVVFGLSWFIIALLPSALVPLSEVMNDYRAFFPYVGLAIAAGWLFSLTWEKWNIGKGEYARVSIGLMILILLGNAVGTFARNNVWRSEESLWKDVTEKSPDNGRGMMNYGLTQMSKGNYPVAEEYYLKTIKLLPQYPYIYVNMGILYSYEKKNDLAENYFKQAISIGYNIPAICYFYAKYLHTTGRDDKALEILKQALSLSPADIDSRYLVMQIYQEQQDWPNLIATANETLTMLPGDKTSMDYLASASGKKGKLEEALDNVKQNPTQNNYISLSLVYYNLKDYQKCIDACNEALKIDPKNKLAYNNLGSAYNVMGEWILAEKAFKQALDIDPGFQLAKNNLAFAVSQLSKTDSLISSVKKAPTPENYINLSLYYYRLGQYQKSIDACKEIIKTNPAYVLAYNKMCAAYNILQQWDNAIAAGEKAVAIRPRQPAC